MFFLHSENRSSNLGAYCSVKMFNTFTLYENVRMVLLILGEFSVVTFFTIYFLYLVVLWLFLMNFIFSVDLWNCVFILNYWFAPKKETTSFSKRLVYVYYTMSLSKRRLRSFFNIVLFNMLWFILQKYTLLLRVH